MGQFVASATGTSILLLYTLFSVLLHEVLRIVIATRCPIAVFPLISSCLPPRHVAVEEGREVAAASDRKNIISRFD